MTTEKKEERALEPLYGDSPPFTFTMRLLGVTPFLFNKFADLEAYELEGVAGRKKPANRMKQDFEAMVWRDEDGHLALPTLNVIATIARAGRYFKSPIASQGSAQTTLQESLIPAAEYAKFVRRANTNGRAVPRYEGVPEWDNIDFRLARNSDMKRSPKPTRRPRMERGWQIQVHIGVIAPEFYTPTNLAEIMARAGSSIGIGDGRKIGFGRFATDGMEVTPGLPW